MLMRRGAREADRPADRFPALTTCPHPDDLRIDRLEPGNPTERRFHATNRGGRRWRQPHRPRRLGHEIAELGGRTRPRTEVVLHTYRRQALQNVRGLRQPLLDHVWRPLRIVHFNTPRKRAARPAMSIALS